jgi:anti-sigma B factor antagonist
MEIMVSQEQGRVPVTVFHIKGDIDANTYEQLESRAERAIGAGTKDILLDLTEVPYVSSAGVRAMNRIFNMLHADMGSGGRAALSKGLRDGTFKSPHLKVLNPSPAVSEVLSATGMDMFLDIRRDAKEALAAFGA